MSREAFVSSRVSTVFHRRLNLSIARVCEARGLRPFLPQQELMELDDDVAILEGNEAAVRRAQVVVVVFDAAGTGVAMELAQALTLGQPVIGYRTRRSRREGRLGSMLEGAWRRLPEGRRCGRLDELDRALARLLA